VALIGTSYLKPENSIITGMATACLVIANYNLHGGTAASASATPAWNADLTGSVRKAGYTSFGWSLFWVLVILATAALVILAPAALVLEWQVLQALTGL